ncbi:Protein UPSTREAM OF FLC [Heracleum sosnowskyi]|uniref:Protein UPSTREAM OF FLC n=1 Tax=Heracleum sosnowskyi TaxID=360622 RepID=A0AAD8N785_9APIA|nr:Protein UPSTREAM OF FLC [Heracleum sosnowskyi]
MNSSARIGRSNSELQTSRTLRYTKNSSPEQSSRAWANLPPTPPPPHPKPQKIVPVLYYLSKNGHLQHPHFIEVPLFSDSLHLRDVINRLNSLRGTAMPSMYSWSSKRSYKNGFVWQDLEEDDIIYPAQGQEYILKGSELLEPPALLQGPPVTFPSKPPEILNSGTEFPAPTRRRNQSWSAIDLHEYKVYKSESAGETAGKFAADASTQTDEMRHRRNAVEKSTELSREEISPPPSESSPETLEALMKADGKIIKRVSVDEKGDDVAVNNHPSGRMKASTVLMQLLTCGSIGFKDCGAGYMREHPGLSVVGSDKARLPRGGVEEEEEQLRGNVKGKVVRVEEKEYFSGSLIQETTKDVFPALKRSSSYNADRSLQMEVKDKEEIGGMSGRCIPRRPRMI